MACVSLGPCIGIVFWAVLFPLLLLRSGRPPHENYHSMVVGMIPLSGSMCLRTYIGTTIP